MKPLKLLILFCLCVSCADREVQLAETHINTTSKIHDVSPIYIFYNEDGSADFNRNNMIGTTNWLVNIDKRLTLNDLVPHLKFLQEKRSKAGMHKNENARNYFTCFNPEQKNLSFIDFTDIIFEDNQARIVLDSDTSDTKIHLKTSKDIDVTPFNGSKFKTEFSLLENAIQTMIDSSSATIDIQLLFDANVQYQDYITLKSILLNLDSDRIHISNNELIYK